MTKKENMVKKIKRNPEISKEDQKILTKDFLRQIKRKGASKPGTQANYLQAANKIIPEINRSIKEISKISDQKLKRLNEKVADKIQESKFRQTSGENTKRRKRQQWATWKEILETQNIQTEKHRKHIPVIKFTENEGKIKRQADTNPEDLPTPDQTKRFIKVIAEQSGETVKLRNQALILLLWDKGPRIGEALNLKMENVSIQGKKVFIDIDERAKNKRSKPREVQVFQGRKTLKDYIESHPAKNNGEAYLFPKLKQGEYFEELSKKPLRRKVHQVKAAGSFNFKTKGEPLHIFRKAFYTSHIINGWATWEECCAVTGKKDDGTKPDYLKMALNDVNASIGEKIGSQVDISTDDSDHRMKGAPLTPVNCLSCDSLNRCFREICNYCGTELPESQMPSKQEDKDSLKEADEIIEQSDSREELIRKLNELEQGEET